MTSKEYERQKMAEEGIQSLDELPRFAQNNGYSGLLPFSRIPRESRNKYVLAGWARCAGKIRGRSGSEVIALYMTSEQKALKTKAMTNDDLNCAVMDAFRKLGIAK